MTAGMPTFQQTFANCPFPEGVLAVLGRCPVQVRVLRARRAMEVAVSGTAVPQEILTQASDILKRVFGLSTVTVAVVQVDSVEHDKQGRQAFMQKDAAAPKTPVLEEKSALEPKTEGPAELPEATVPTPPQPPSQDLESQMKAMRRRLTGKQSTAAGREPGVKKKHQKAIYGKISIRKKPTPLNELTLDMGTVLVEGEVFNIEHRELTRKKAWVVCFDITDYTSSIRVTRYLDGEEAKPVVAQVKKGQRLQI